MLEKAGTIKLFEYLLLACELKKQTNILKKLHQGLSKINRFDKEDCEMVKKQELKSVKILSTNINIASINTMISLSLSLRGTLSSQNIMIYTTSIYILINSTV